jgi:hypothetical protein
MSHVLKNISGVLSNDFTFSSCFFLISVKLLIKSIKAISWFASYLHDRAQCVSVGGKCSSWLDVNSGVPEGSIFGPLLFTLYVYNIGGNLKYLFTDDDKIYYSFHPDDIGGTVRTVNEDLMAIQRWALANDLSLNASKTQFLLCGSPHKLMLFLNGAELTFSEVVKNMGVLFDDSLSGRDVCCKFI